MRAAIPDGTDRMDDIFRIQIKSFRHRRFARLDGTDLFSFFEQFFITGRLIDCHVGTSANHRLGIGGIDDGIGLHF